MLDFTITFGITLINLGILFLGIKYFLWKPVTNMLETREKKIADDINKAQKEKERAEQLKIQYESFLKEAEEERLSLIKEAEDEGRLRASELVREGKENAEIFLVKARSEIEYEKTLAQKELKNYVSDLAMQVAEKLIATDMDSEKNRSYVKNMLDKGDIA